MSDQIWYLPSLSDILILNTSKTKLKKFENKYLYYKTSSYYLHELAYKELLVRFKIQGLRKGKLLADVAFPWDLVNNKITDNKLLTRKPFRVPPWQATNKDVLADAGNFQLYKIINRYNYLITKNSTDIHVFLFFFLMDKSEFRSAALISWVILHSFLSM